MTGQGPTEADLIAAARAMPPPPHNPFAAVGLGQNWQPGACNWHWLGEIETDKGARLFLIGFDTVAGRIGIAFGDEGLRRFVEQAQEKLTGIEVARPSLVTP